MTRIGLMKTDFFMDAQMVMIDTRMTQIGLMNTDFFMDAQMVMIDTRMTQIGLMNTDFYRSWIGLRETDFLSVSIRFISFIRVSICIFFYNSSSIFTTPSFFKIK